jgi:lipid-A-disaccharide synthase
MEHVTIISGDHSSDVYAEEIALTVKNQYPNCEIHGIGGPKLRALAPDVLSQDILGLVGIFEILSSIIPVLLLRQKLLQRLKNLPPHVVILMDSPGFNMTLLRPLAKKHTLIYAIPPQVWAWHESRVHALKRYCQELWVLYPFEAEFYAKHQLPTQILRHPLATKPHLALRAMAKNPKPVVALLPGSRNNEKKLLMPILLQMTSSMPHVDWVWVEAKPGFLTKDYPGLKGKIVEGLAELPAVDAAVAASGTVTLELGLMGIPMLIVYKVHPLTAWIAKKLIRVSWIGLPNILLKHSVCPEIIQEALTEQNLSRALNELLAHGLAQQHAALSLLHEELSDKAPTISQNVQRLLEKYSSLALPS